MDLKRKVQLTTPKIPSPEIQREVEKLHKVFAQTEEYMEKLSTSANITIKHVDLSAQARKAGNELLAQKGHDEDVHYETLLSYSKSVALAPYDTEELVFGYGNRAALLMHLQHYEEALVDIDRALQLSKSEDYKKKLQVRRDKCSELLDEQNLVKSTKRWALTERKELDKLRTTLEDFKPSATVSCAADCVGVGYNKKFGRHLVATRDIRPGEIVIIDKGYAGSAILSKTHLVCSHCMQIAWNGIPCDECAYAIYCSEDCKNEAFKEYHDIECRILKYLQHVIFNTENGVHLLTTTRLLITALRKEGLAVVMKEITEEKTRDDLDALLTDGIFRSDGFRACYNLSTRVQDVGAENKKLETQVLQILYLLTHYTDFPMMLIENNSSAKENTMVDSCVLLELKKAMMRIKSVAATNGYPLQPGPTDYGQCTGVKDHKVRCNVVWGNAVTPFCSLINHSCTPNVFYLSVPKRRFIIFSTCPIKKGEMFCRSYSNVDLFFSGLPDVRQKELSSFNCECPVCKIKDKTEVNEYLNKRVKNISGLKKNLNNMSSKVTKAYMRNNMNELVCSLTTFRKVQEVSEMIYTVFKDYRSYIHNDPCVSYVIKVIMTLYQEETLMPTVC